MHFGICQHTDTLERYQRLLIIHLLYNARFQYFAD